MSTRNTWGWRYLFRFAVGAVFVWAALAKISDLPGFSQEIHNYRILPLALENIAAIGMAWVELVAGMALVLNLAPRSGSLVVGGMLVLFFVAIAQAIARNLDIDCGCFGTSDASRVGWMALGRDALLMAMTWIGYPRATRAS